MATCSNGQNKITFSGNAVEKITTYAVNTQDSMGKTPFHCACSKGQLSIVKLLQQLNVDTGRVDMYGRTGLSCAVASGESQMVAHLLHAGPLRGRDAGKVLSLQAPSPISHASADGHTEIVRLLLAKHVSLLHEPLMSNGDTPLHLACRYGHTETVKCLLSHNANPNALNKQLMTPLHVAQYNVHEDIIALLSNRPAHDVFCDHTACHDAHCKDPRHLPKQDATGPFYWFTDTHEWWRAEPVSPSEQ